MTNKEFDRWLRESMSSVQPEFNPQDWDDFVQRVEESESQLDTGFDDAIRNAVATLGADLTPDWQHMEHQLETDESQFDQHVKQTIENFEVPYNSTTWPTLHARLSEDERIRRHLVSIKILEIAAIFIAFLTFYNFFPTFNSSVIKPAEDLIRKELSKKESAMQIENITAASASRVASGTDVHPVKNSNISAIHAPALSTEQRSVTDHASISTSTIDHTGRMDEISTPISDEQLIIETHTYLFGVPTEDDMTTSGQQSQMRIPVTEMISPLAVSSVGILTSTEVTPFLNSTLMLTPVLEKISRLRFGMMAASEINTLFFPEEHFYSQGRSINFSEKEIVAGGYSAGASLLFDFKKLMIETGLTYSSKTFGPDRNLFIGSSSDRHTLDFENITLNVVSLPLYVHWKLDGKGLWRVYATGGASMHVIANANYDLIAENIYTASAVQDPHQLQNEREVKRVREHMLDGAKFSSKGYLTAAGGFGVERYLNTRMSVFVQPMYQYQIPFFGLIDQNGKHLQNGSLLLGTRISL